MVGDGAREGKPSARPNGHATLVGRGGEDVAGRGCCGWVVVEKKKGNQARVQMYTQRLAGGGGDVDYDAAADDAAADDAAADAALPPAAVPMAPPTPTCSWLATGMRTKMHMTDMQCTTH